jgi:hypothetical protein
VSRLPNIPRYRGGRRHPEGLVVQRQDGATIGRPTQVAVDLRALRGSPSRFRPQRLVGYEPDAADIPVGVLPPVGPILDLDKRHPQDRIVTSEHFVEGRHNQSR